MGQIIQLIENGFKYFPLVQIGSLCLKLVQKGWKGVKVFLTNQNGSHTLNILKGSPGDVRVTRIWLWVKSVSKIGMKIDVREGIKKEKK